MGRWPSPPRAANPRQGSSLGWETWFCFVFFFLRLFGAIWLIRTLVTTITQYQQQPWQNQNHLFSKTLPLKEADALPREDSAPWHQPDWWGWWRCTKKSTIIYGHDFKIVFKSCHLQSSSDGRTFGLPSPPAQSRARLWPLCDYSSEQHGIKINNNNINNDDDQSLDNTAQQGKLSRNITTEPFAPCFCARRRMTRCFVKQQPNGYLLLWFCDLKVAARRWLFLLGTIAIFW